MSTSDPIADLLTRMRNACEVKHRYVDIPWSKMKEEIVKILEKSGFVKGYRTRKQGTRGTMRVYLKYGTNRQCALSTLKRVSRPGLRRYVGAGDIPLVLNGMGIAILSTSKGILEGHHARKEGVGGELLCFVS